MISFPTTTSKWISRNKLTVRPTWALEHLTIFRLLVGNLHLSTGRITGFHFSKPLPLSQVSPRASRRRVSLTHYQPNPSSSQRPRKGKLNLRSRSLVSVSGGAMLSSASETSPRSGGVAWDSQRCLYVHLKLVSDYRLLQTRKEPVVPGSQDGPRNAFGLLPRYQGG
jgi:hypothetical protein